MYKIILALGIFSTAEQVIIIKNMLHKKMQLINAQALCNLGKKLAICAHNFVKKYLPN